MKTLLGVAWSFSFLLSFSAVAIIWIGAAIFGWHFLRTNAAAAKTDSDDVPRKSWRGRGAKRGIWTFGVGIVAFMVALLLERVLPHVG